MNLRNLVFDADGTLLEDENPYLILARELKCEDVVRAWVGEYLSQKISYVELVEREVKIFVSQYKKIFGDFPHTGDLEKFLPRIKVRPGVKELVERLIDRGISIYVLSSGFLYLIKSLTQLKIKLEDIYANRLLYDTSGEFVKINIDVGGEKTGGFDRLMKDGGLKMVETAYVGDNAFDEVVMNYVLKEGGTVFFLQGGVKEFSLKRLPVSPRFTTISDLTQLLNFLS